MTARETQIAKKILDCLHELDGGQTHPLGIHAEIGGTVFCSGGEFDSVLAELDTRRAVLGLKSKNRGWLWNITDAGEALRLQL